MYITLEYVRKINSNVCARNIGGEEVKQMQEFFCYIGSRITKKMLDGRPKMGTVSKQRESFAVKRILL